MPTSREMLAFEAGVKAALKAVDRRLEYLDEEILEMGEGWEHFEELLPDDETSPEQALVDALTEIADMRHWRDVGIHADQQSCRWVGHWPGGDKDTRNSPAWLIAKRALAAYRKQGGQFRGDWRWAWWES